MAELTVKRQRRQAQCFTEPLGDGIALEMTLIPAGTFVMGSPEEELERLEWEGPQHEVAVPSFFMGTYAITQAQWRVMGRMPEIDIELNPDPARFKGDQNPVEQVNWLEAVEFCKRLTAHTGRPYRLPSEAEWEYACRAGTRTPFHFGETISPELANYDGSIAFAGGPTGQYRQKTTPVGSLQVANAFGLYDMHGNVWEWCADVWHGSYDGAPTDGSVWTEGGDQDRRVFRGGSWDGYSWYCRSAARSYDMLGYRDSYLGFRVCCSAPGFS